jgi:hypothetical protein
MKYLKIYEDFNKPNKTRSVEISSYEFSKILKEKCKDFIRNPKPLLRSKRYNVDGNPSKYSYINPKKFHRKNLDDIQHGVSTAHYQILIDNLPSWSNFPKRSNSVIGLTGFNDKVVYGTHRFFIIPFDGANFGLSPAPDLWIPEANISNGRPLMTDPVIRFNDTFVQILSDLGVPDDNYGNMISYLQDLFNNWLGETTFDKIYGEETFIRKVFKKFEEGGFKNVGLALDHYLSPDKFSEGGFKSVDYRGILDSDYFDLGISEFWTDSECLLWYIGDTYSKSYMRSSFNELTKIF